MPKAALKVELDIHGVPL